MKFWEYSCVYILFAVATGERINIAFSKPTSQSSTDGLLNGWAYKAVDGDTNQNYDHGSCTQTTYSGGWWEVDLEATYNIKEVIVYSREGFEYSLSNYKLLGAVDCNENGQSTCYSECYHQQAEEKVHHLIITNCIARYIQIRNLIDARFSLCEVQIYAEQVQELSTPYIPEVRSLKPIITTTKSANLVSPWLKIPSAFTTLTTVSTALKTTVGPVDIHERTAASSAEVTTPRDAIFLNESSSCGCFCHAVHQGGKTTEFIEQTKDEIKKNLIVAAEKLSSTIRKKTSAKDERPSAVYTGYIGIVIIVITLGTLILSDLISVVKFVCQQMNK